MNRDIEKLHKQIKENANKISSNAKRIQRNTGALEILKTFKSDSNKFYTMWLITFFSFLISIGFNIFLLIR